MSHNSQARSADSSQPELFSKFHAALGEALEDHGLLAEPNALVIFMTLVSVVAQKGKPNRANWVHVRVRSLAEVRALSRSTVQRALRFLLDHRFVVRNERDVTLYAIPSRLFSIGQFYATCRTDLLPHPAEVISFDRTLKRALTATRRKVAVAV